MENLKKKTTTAFIWDFIGRIGNQGVGFIVSIFLARLLEPEEYGLMAMINVIIGMSAVFADMGLGGSLIQRKRLHAVHYNSVFWFNTCIAATLSISLYLAAPFVARFYERPELLNITRVMSLSFIINGLATIQNTYLKKQLIFKYFVQFRIIGAVASGILGIYLAYSGYGVWALVAQTLTANSIYLILIWIVAKWKPNFTFSFKALKQLWSFGFRMFLSTVIHTLFLQIDVLIIGKAYSPNQLGFFQRAKGLNNMITNYTSGSLISVLFPMLSLLQNNDKEYIKTVKNIHHMLVFTTFAISGIFFLTAKDIIVILFTEKWLPSVIFFKILIVGRGFISPINSLLSNILSSRGNSKDYLRVDILKKIILLCAFPFLFYYSLKEYLYVFVLCLYIGMIINYYYAVKELKISIHIFLKPLLITASTSFCLIFSLSNILVFTNNYLNIVANIIVYTLSFIGINYLLKTEGLFLIIEKARKTMKL
ncbi:lipopolysaccharide biosynthesis protein [Saccharicrinis aurantiacus]|uniref:lipopolysaccharide biosynthesis protein n=1 Tax=Saccharicrinis aurantiacus TaxID=1849719 RepID=UPI0024900587|nr:lipopolysaccharide biosynthesis protein [Saccharicrinis aurantiacus]